MGDYYIYRGNSRLRCGFTTGSCAAAAAKAAAWMLVTQRETGSVSLMTPAGILFDAKVENAVFDQKAASCAVRKDGGDDPDVTDGILIFARVESVPSGITVEGGEGIGRVTVEGLDQPVGAAAINSVPRKMIAGAVDEIFMSHRFHGGARVIIYAPEGASLASRTYNPRMGIEGGISIIGTTGIVEPMSSKALVDTMRLETRIRSAEGRKSLLLTIGNYGRSFLAESIPALSGKSVTCSNFIGEAIDAALEFGFESILIVGHIGKLVKLGAGIMNTHSSSADGRMDVLVTCGVLAGADTALLRRIPECVTVDAALAILDEAGMLQPAMEKLMEKTQYYLDARVGDNAKIGAVMFSYQHGIVGMTGNAEELIGRISEEYNG